uniref:Uncharacterized protein n=1 Tax=Lepeophtheirus salmonis TaxID=72036 RepID=A0A0K2U2H9_LEPSM
MAIKNKIWRSPRIAIMKIPRICEITDGNTITD